MLNLKYLQIFTLIEIIVFMGLCFGNPGMILQTGAQENGINVDKYELDPIEDVRKMGASEILTPVAGFENIDIVKLKSYHPEGELGLPREFEVVLELEIFGTVTDDDGIYYMFIVEADSEDYIITYNNGSAEGQSLDEPFSPSFSVNSEGSGTSTLSVTLNLFSVDNPKEHFDWTGLGMVLDEDQSEFQYMDKAPDKLMKITTPTDQSTVHSEIEIAGIIEPSITTITAVEYQLGTKYPDGWSQISDFQEGDKSWKISWDSTTAEDNKPIEVYCRATDGEIYFEDEITLYVKQSNKDNPEQVSKLTVLSIGDVFKYSSTHDPSYMGLQLEVITDLTETVSDIENVTVNGNNYPTWRKELSGDGVVTYANIPIEFTLDGYSHITTSGMDTVDSKEDITINVPLIGGIETNTEVKYDPPLEVYDFPLVIGETWESVNNVESKTTIRYSGDYAEDTSDENVEFIFEALHTEQTEVSAGIFDTYVVRMQQKDSDMYELLYYSPEIGNNVRSESYDNNRELLDRIDLWEFNPGKGGLVKIVDITLEPGEPAVNDDVTISVKLRNSGTANLTDSDVTIKIDNNILKAEQVDLESLQTLVIDFHWKPKEPGKNIITVITPDDSKNKEVQVRKENTDAFLGFGEGEVYILLLIILIIVVILILIIKRTNKKSSEKGTKANRHGPSVFDTGTEPVRNDGDLEEPKVIRYQKGFTQLGDNIPEKQETKKR